MPDVPPATPAPQPPGTVPGAAPDPAAAPSAPYVGPPQPRDLPPGTAYAPTGPRAAAPATPGARTRGERDFVRMPDTGRWPPFDPAEPPPPRGRRAEPPLFLFETGVDPVFGHPLWRIPGAVPSVRVDVRYRVTEDGRFTYDAASGPHDTARAFVATLIRFMRAFGPHLAPERVPLRWYGIPAGFGGFQTPDLQRKYPNRIPLLGHPDDALAGDARGPFAEAGVRANRDWSREMLGHLAAELKARGLPDPLAWILTSENGVGDDYAGHIGDPDTGWVNKALADQRSGDPAYAIDGHRTFRQYMRDARTLEGGPVPRHEDKRLGHPPGRSPHNAESSERYRGAVRLCWDWARERAINRVAREAFARDASDPLRTVRVGEYDAACDSKWAPVRILPGKRLHQMDGIFYTDLQCPSWYGGFSDWPLAEEPFAADSPGWHTLGNWKRVYPNDERDPELSKRRVALDAYKAIAEAHARSAPHAPLAPYVSAFAPEPDMVEYLRHCRDLGMWGVNVFMPKPDAAVYDYWARVMARLAD